MPKPWLRLWDKTLDNCKAQSLPLELFRAWINLLCLANRQDDRGQLPDLKAIAFGLRTTMKQAEMIVSQLKDAGFIDPDGQMHDWDDWQPDVDDVAERVRRHRDRKKAGNVTRNVTETLHGENGNVTETVTLAGALPGARSETETDTETEGDSPPPPSTPPAELGPEYRTVAEVAMQLGGDVSWGPWVDRMGHLGYSAAWIKSALDAGVAKDKLTRSYLQGILRGYQAEGGPPKVQGYSRGPGAARVRPAEVRTKIERPILPDHLKNNPKFQSAMAAWDRLEGKS